MYDVRARENTFVKHCKAKSLFPFLLTLALFASGWWISPQAEASRLLPQKTLRQFLAMKPTRKLLLERALWHQSLTPSDVQPYKQAELRYLRNAIFALKGAKFQSKDLRKFFAKQRWYQPRQAASSIRLSEQAKKNATLLQTAERILALSNYNNRLIGEWPQLSQKRGTITCLRFKQYEVVQGRRWLLVRGHTKNCSLSAQKGKIYMRLALDDQQSLLGIFDEKMFTLTYGSSDMQNLHIYNITNGKLLFRKQDVPGNVAAQIDKSKKALLFEAPLVMPKAKACQPLLSPSQNQYARDMKACWQLVQKKYPALRRVTPPVCKCKDLSPFVRVQYRISLKNLKAKPQPTGQQVDCGCWS